jgi:dTDP-glucose 4,6-dehydratase
MKFLVYGATGWIGQQVVQLLQRHEGYCVQPAAARLDNVHAVQEELDAVQPDRVILAAGITGRPNVDWCETHQEETANVNFYGTLALIKACELRGIHITNFATGCIFEYDEKHPVNGPGFTEDDAPNFFGSFYSRTKAAVELASKDSPVQLLLRVRMPISADGSPRCFITKIARYAKIVSVPNSMTVLEDLLPLAVHMAIAGDVGVYNLVNPGPVSHADILNAYRQLVDPFFTYTLMDMDEHNTVTVARRSNNTLNTQKLQARFGGVVPDALTSIKRLLQQHAPLLRNQYVPKSLFITGGAGFIGSGFVNYVLTVAPTMRVTVYDNLSSCASKEHLKGMNLVFVHGDITDAAQVQTALRESGADTVVHFAAQTHVDNSFGNSLAFTHTNVLGTHVLLQCARASPGLKRFVHISTDEVYGETVEAEAACEDRVLMPTNPYAASKVGAEALVHAYFKSYALPTVTVRCNNVYGPRQFPEKVMPRFLLRHMAGLPLQFQGTGKQSRHFLYVDDAASAVATVMSRGAVGGTYNVGSDEELTIRQLAQKVRGKDYDSEDSEDSAKDNCVTVADRPFNDCRYWIDDGKLRALGWAPRVSFPDGLCRTREWYTSVLLNLDTIWPEAWDAVRALDGST